MKAIGIDIGTTSVCGVLIDAATGGVEKSVTKNSNAFIEGCAEWEKIQSVDKIMTVATDILESLIVEGGDVGVIGITGQMHGIVYTDKDGNAVSPLYTWQDGRGNLPYKDTTYAKYLNSFSGYGNVTDFYNAENGIKPESAVSYCTIHDYFVMRLCELKKPIMHTSDAASFGCYDLENNRFNYDCTTEITGDFRIEGEYTGIPVSVAIGDNQASVFSTLTDENDVLVNIGTGSQISVISDKIADSAQIETRPYFEGKYLLAGAALCGGRSYALLENFFRQTLRLAGGPDISLYGAMERALDEAGEITDAPEATTLFQGTRENPALRGSFREISCENFTPVHFMHSVMNGMAQELFAMYQGFLDAGGAKPEAMIGSGNGLRKNRHLQKAFERVFSCPMTLSRCEEEAACGAARWALACRAD